MQTSRIIQLAAVVSNQIAAGEVVERPASVVKELLENSIDAGASKIEVEIEGGGIHLIRVRDNGTGIVKEDLVLAFLRHATSKIQTTEDLTSIHSLGFRGEALASIASVSRCRLVSQALHQENAWQIQIQPDLSTSIQPAAHPQGTTIEVADLFYNTPVRRKFLRSEKTEFQAIDEVLKRLSLAYPMISFSLKHQQRQIRSFIAISSDKDELARLGKICGQQFMENAIAFSIDNVGMTLMGWLSPSKLGHRQADCQYFFVNQRMVKDRLLNHALKMVYQQDAEYVEGTYPNYVLFLTLDPNEVDVNVHPTKQEVRFSEPRFVHDFITKCIEMTLNQQQPSVAISKLAVPAQLQITQESKLATHHFYQQAATTLPSDKISLMPSKRYVFSENNEGLILIDLQKAKTPFMKFLLEKQWGLVPKKPLLFPLSINIQSDLSLTQEKLLLLKPLGLHFRLESQKMLILLEQPIFLFEKQIETVLGNFLMSLPVEWTKLTLCQNLAECLSIESLNKALENEGVKELQDWLMEKPKGRWLKLSHQMIETLLEQSANEV